MTIYTNYQSGRRFECDCGAVYSHVDQLHACANRQHGRREALKFTIEVDPERNPNAVGEYLRSEFFAADGPDEIGCYTVHEWRTDVAPLPPQPIPSEDGVEVGAWTRGRKNGIECRWFWDGDGTLAFLLPDGQYLVNYDCKKDHGWYLTDYLND